MEEVKTFNFDSGSNNLLAALLPSLQQRGVDTGMLMGMLGGGNRGGFFGNNGGFQDIIALIVIAAIFGNGNGNGIFGGGGNNNTEREMLMSAIQRNGVDLSQLAQTLNCSMGKLDTAIGQVSTQICNLAGQQGLGFQQVINSIQAGNSALAGQIANCCCDLKGVINNVAVGMERGFSSIGFETQRQTCAIEKSIADSTEKILAGQRAAEMREMQAKIDSLQEEKQTYKLGGMITAATAPLMAEVEKIKCKLPETYPVQYQPFAAVPNCVAAQWGLYGFPYGTGNGAFF